MRTRLHRPAPDSIIYDQENPGLADLIEISWRPNLLNAGAPLVSPPNFGQNSSRQPINGWRYSPDLDAAAGVAPRDTGIAVYNTTLAGSNQAKQTLVPPELMYAYQGDKLQYVSAGPVAFVPGGTAVLSGNPNEG